MAECSEQTLVAACLEPTPAVECLEATLVWELRLAPTSTKEKRFILGVAFLKIGIILVNFFYHSNSPFTSVCQCVWFGMPVPFLDVLIQCSDALCVVDVRYRVLASEQNRGHSHRRRERRRRGEGGREGKGNDKATVH